MMRNLLTRLKFDFWYLRRPPWDTQITPPELHEFINNHTPGRAIDLGCGTGTNVLSLAKAGWDVSGVDYSWRAIRKARERLGQAGFACDLRVGDVTDLANIKGKFKLVLDIGCFHQLDSTGREKYRKNLSRLLEQNGHYLMYAHFRQDGGGKSHGIEESDLKKFEKVLTVVRRTDGHEGARGPSVWVWYSKETG